MDTTIERVAAFRRAASTDPSSDLGAGDAAIAELLREIGADPAALKFAALAAHTRPVEAITLTLRSVDTTNMPATGAIGKLLQLGRARYGDAPLNERRPWTALAIFSGYFILEQATYVLHACGIADAEDTLGILIAKRIVVRETNGGGFRFSIPALYRVPARTALASNPSTNSCARLGLRTWWLDFSLTFQRKWFGSDQAKLFAEVEEHLGDLDSLFEQSESDEAGDVIEILTRLEPFWEVTARAEIAVAHLDRALGMGGPSLEQRFAAQCQIVWLASAYDLQRADAALEDAIALSVTTSEATARLNRVRGLCALYRGQDALARRHFQESLDHDLTHANNAQVFIDLSLCASASSLGGDQRAAYEFCERALALGERSGERWLRNYLLWAFALAAWRDGDRHRSYVLALDAVTTATEIGDQYGGAISLEVVAWYEAAEGDMDLAAWLFGLADSLRLAVRMPTLFWGTKAHHDAGVSAAMARLGPREFWRSFREGRNKGLRDALNALNGEPPSEERFDPIAEVDSGALTPRQREIADLIAKGRSNKEIGRLLVITVRTVETHIENIFTKLNVVSRAQVAVWSTRRSEDRSRPVSSGSSRLSHVEDERST